MIGKSTTKNSLEATANLTSVEQLCGSTFVEQLLLLGMVSVFLTRGQLSSLDSLVSLKGQAYGANRYDVVHPLDHEKNASNILLMW